MHISRRVSRSVWVTTVLGSLSVAILVCASPALSEVGSCPISADFVVEPEILESIQQMGGVAVASTTKRAYVDGAMVQIECIGIAADQVFPNRNDESVLQDYARFWSIQPTGPAFSVDKPIPHFVLEGVKEVQGISVTYTYRLFRFEDNFAMVATGVPGGKLTADVSQFLDSIEITAPPSFTEADKAEGRKSHMATCIPASRADNEKRQLGLSEVEIAYFCSCTGIRYFDDFTRSEIRTLAIGDDPSLVQRRLMIQSDCLNQTLR